MNLVLAGGWIVPHELGVVLGMNHDDLRAVGTEGHDRAALAHAVGELLRHDAQRGERGSESLRRPQGSVLFFYDLRRVAEMIAVRMGDQHEIDFAQRVRIAVLLRRFGIFAEIWIDDDDFPARRRDSGRGLAQPDWALIKRPPRSFATTGPHIGRYLMPPRWRCTSRQDSTTRYR